MANLSDLSFYVPTRGRTHWSSLPTLDEFRTGDLLSRVTIVCPQVEVAHWQAQYPEVKAVVGRPLKIQNLSQCRAWMVETCPTRYIYLMDDDCTFRVQYEEDRTTVRIDKDVPRFQWAMTHHLLDLFQTYPQVAFGNYFMCNRRPMLKEVGWAGYTWGYDREILAPVVAPALRRLPLYSDVDQLMTLLKAGYKNVVSGYAVVSASPPAVTPEAGGCGVYRTPELVEQARQGLIAIHGEFIRERSPAKHSKHPQATLNFQWKRAYDWGVARRAENG